MLEDGKPATTKECMAASGMGETEASRALSEAKKAGNVHHNESQETYQITEQGRKILTGELPALGRPEEGL